LYITLVGEHMLALVQAFEPFASSPTNLDLANEIMNEIREVALLAWTEFASAAGGPASTDVARALMNGVEIKRFSLLGGEIDGEQDEIDAESEEPSSKFCNAWLDAVGLAVTGLVLEKVMRVPHLTPRGCDQLHADLGYLVNVFTALGVSGHPHILLLHVKEVCILAEQDLLQQVKSRSRSISSEAALRSIEERIAAMKGAK
jgi:hypothetical protein